MLITTKIDLDKYLKLLDNTMDGITLYHQGLWLRTVKKGLGVDVYGLQTESEKHNLIALTPIMQKKKGFLTLVGSPLRGSYTEFAGPVFVEGVSSTLKREAIMSQHGFLRSIGASYIEWGCKEGDEVRYLDVLSDLGCEYSQKKTFIIDVADTHEQMWAKLKSTARNKVRKAKKQGVIVKTISKPTVDDVRDYYFLLEETFQRRDMYVPHPFLFYDELCQQIPKNGWLNLFVALHDGKMVAGAIFLLYGNRMMYMSGASNQDGSRLAANNLLQWEAIEFAVNNGFSEYDMGGAGNATIDKFKSSFGGIPFHHHKWTYKSWVASKTEALFSMLVKRGWIRVNG